MGCRASKGVTLVPGELPSVLLKEGRRASGYHGCRCRFACWRLWKIRQFDLLMDMAALTPPLPPPF